MQFDQHLWTLLIHIFRNCHQDYLNQPIDLN